MHQKETNAAEMLYIYYLYEVKGLGVKGYLLRAGCELLVAIQAPGEGGGGGVAQQPQDPAPPPPPPPTPPKKSMLISKPSKKDQCL